MTAKHLPPDTAREVSSLKRRVSDLERMLDRLRRLQAKTSTTTFNTPYASLTGGGTAIADDTLTVLTPTDSPVLDPTGHILVDHEDDTHGWFTFRIPGYYEIGGTVRFLEDTGLGQRTLAIWTTDSEASPGLPLTVLTVDRSPTDTTVLSGSRMIYADQSTVTRWHIAAAHNAGGTLDVECESFWTRLVTTAEPPTGGIGG